jgi:hypothetical protein
MPAMIVLKKYPKEVLVVVGDRLAEVTWFYTVVTFTLAYATNTLGIDRMVMLDADDGGVKGQVWQLDNIIDVYGRSIQYPLNYDGCATHVFAR